MTVGRSDSPARISRCVSELSPNNSPSPPPSSPELFNEPHDIASLDREARGRRRHRRTAPRQVSDIKENRHGPLRRFVSQEEFTPCDLESDILPHPRMEGVDESGIDQSRRKRPSGSPMRCVSEFDEVAASEDAENLTRDSVRLPLSKRVSDVYDTVDVSSARALHVDLKESEMKQEPTAPHLPNPLYHSGVLATHTRALRVEAELFPMRLILSRLMSNIHHNRRQVFNKPVDPVSLGIPDYFDIVKEPMDLGTVKAGLHAVAYSCREDVAKDIRLVFNNAIRYNPPDNSVHQSARILLAEFEKAYGAVKQPTVIKSSIPRASLNNQAFAPVSAMIPTSANTVESSAQGFETAKSSTTRRADALDAASGSSSTPLPQPSVLPLDGPEQAQAPAVCMTVSNRSSRGTRQTGCRPLDPEKALKKARVSRKRERLPHSCQSCLGRSCAVCLQGCLQHEPTLLLCAGANCHGARIRKGAVYFIAADGSCQFCQRCYANLSSVLPATNDHGSCSGVVRYKRDLLKRKNEEEIVEEWVTCVKCRGGLHHICAMHNKVVHDKAEYICPSCVSPPEEIHRNEDCLSNRLDHDISQDENYTFLSGSDLPVKLDEVIPNGYRLGEQILSADTLAHTPISAFMQQKVRDQMVSEDCPNAENTVVVRVISDCDKHFRVPDVVRKHFRMEVSDTTRGNTGDDGIPPPSAVKYNSKAFALFQKIDGFDVCVFCMYVQEYDGDYEYDEMVDQDGITIQKKVYIAYLDSVEHFRPRPCRTRVYHEMLVAYLASARARGYESAHIWACPPTRGNSFVFWNHPATQRTPTRERLVAWYHGALSRAVDCGVVSDVKSLYESSFEKYGASLRDGDVTTDPGMVQGGRLVCPPLLDGDFWIEEAVRIHAASMARNLRNNTRASTQGSVIANKIGPSDCGSCCPAMMVASLLQDRLLAHPSSKPFRRPVNAAALKLKDYHTVISRPMDLGTVYSRCLLGEFVSLSDLVSDVELVFTNAMRYNPKGHFVHNMAIEMRDLFFKELDFMTSCWARTEGVDRTTSSSWLTFADLSMSLDERLSCSDLSIDGQAKESADRETEGGEGSQTAPSTDCAPAVSGPSKQPVTDSPSSGRGKKLLRKDSQRQIEPLTEGPNAIMQRMVGDDVWLMDKRNPVPPKGAKKACGKRKSYVSSGDDQHPKRRRQSWLGEEVGESVRKLRTCFFTCKLTAETELTADEQQKLDDFNSYVASFDRTELLQDRALPSGIADSRHALLEISQYRNFEFDTLRRAKYSTNMLLYHLHNDAPGLIPTCTTCRDTITDVRWHKVKKTVERRQSGRGPGRHAKVVSWNPALPAKVAAWRAEELCGKCHSNKPNRGDFIPIQVSIQT